MVMGRPVSQGAASDGSDLTNRTHVGQTQQTPDPYDYVAMLANAERMESMKSLTPPPGGISESEREVQLASFEVKMRQYCLDLLQPTIRKNANMDHELKAVQEDLHLKSAQIADLLRLAAKVEMQVATLENFRQELAKFDMERRQWQGEATESLTNMKQDQDAFRYQLERMDSSVHSAQRTVDRVSGELGRIQEAADSLRTHTDRRLSQHNKTLNTFKADLEVKLVSLETRHNKLSDDLWGEETGLAKVMHDLSRTNEIVTTMSTEFSSMKHDKASISQLQVVQEEVNNFTNEANNNVSALKATVDRMMGDMKEHFKTATNTVAAHNAAMIQEVRTAYQEELRGTAEVREEVKKFMQSERQHRESLEHSISQSQEQTEDLVHKVTSEVEEVGKVRRRDRNSHEVEIKAVAHQLKTVQESSETVAASLEHLSGIIWMMVQCERAASALDMQDDTDRSKVALIGYKDESSSEKGARGGGKRSSSRGPSPGPGNAAPANAQTVINLDERCLSCCGKAQTVLSGFKMACLQYTPGPVSFSRKAYHRSDLLGLREKLLAQAHESLQLGPVNFEKPDFFGSTIVNTISAGAIVEALAGKTERTESRNSNGSTRSKHSGSTMPPIPSARATPR